MSKPLHFFGTFFRSLSQASGLYFVFLKAWQLYQQNKYRRRETRQNFKIKIQLARTSWNALAELSIKSSINSNSNWITAEILMLALFLRSSCLPDFIYSLLCLLLIRRLLQNLCWFGKCPKMHTNWPQFNSFLCLFETTVTYLC